MNIFYENVLKNLNEIGEKLQLSKSMIDQLSVSNLELVVNIPIRMDNGNVQVFRGFRVQHNNWAGPYKGGIRWHPNVDIDTVRALATDMTWKTALLDLPLGGGKGGIICDPKELSDKEKERLMRGYVRAIYPIIGPNKDVPAPDVGTTSQLMDIAMDEYSKITGKYSPGSFTGKSIPEDGSLGRDDATARGGMYCLETTIPKDTKNVTVAIQGFGNAGLHAAKLAVEMGMKVIAVSDSKGCRYDPNGLDINMVEKTKKVTGSVYNPLDEIQLDNDDLLTLPVDVLILAAMENVITRENAKKIRARVILELANGPTTNEADDILYNMGVHVIPDFLANAGGVVVSYFEMCQNRDNVYWSKDYVQYRLHERMVSTYLKVYGLSKELKISMRKAAYMIAVKKVLSMKFLEADYKC